MELNLNCEFKQISDRNYIQNDAELKQYLPQLLNALKIYDFVRE